MIDYTRRITQVTVVPRGEPIFSEQATKIEVRDEAAGEFLIVSQMGGHVEIDNAIAFDADEWGSIRDAVEFMIKQVKESG